MKKKIIFQLFFFLIILFLSILFFIKYFFSEEPIQKTQIINEVSEDMISDIKYESSDSEGNRYLIKAKSGTSLPGEDNKIKLKNVEAKLTFDNNEEIVVNSDSIVSNLVLKFSHLLQFTIKIILTQNFLKMLKLNMNFKKLSVIIWKSYLLKIKQF